MTLEELRARRGTRIRMIAAGRGATDIRALGSFARGDQQPESGLDFVVDSNPPFFVDLRGLWLDLQAELGCKLDVASVRGLSPA